MAFIDGTIVKRGVARFAIALHASATSIQWVVESYALLLASLLLLGGSLGDLYGRRSAFVSGVLLFAIGSSWCGVATSITSLIVARGLQGIGAALLVPGSLHVISASYPENERGRAIGTWSGFTAITAAIRPSPRRMVGTTCVVAVGLLHQSSTRDLIVIAVSLWRVPESRDEAACKTLRLAGRPARYLWPWSDYLRPSSRIQRRRQDCYSSPLGPGVSWVWARCFAFFL